MDAPTTVTDRAQRRSPIGGFIFTVAALALVMATSTAPSPFYPSIEQRLDLDVVDISLIFAVYPAGLLVTMLVAGALSDYIGRRPTICAGLVVLAASMLAFANGDSLAVLLTARVLQGVGAAFVMSTASTYMAELTPPRMAAQAALANSSGPTAGLALGALFGGVVLDLTARAMPITFGALIALSVALALLVWALPETSPRLRGIAQSFIPRWSLPADVRGVLLRTAPAIVASWGTGGLFISLGAHIVEGVFDLHGHTLQGAVVGILAGTAAITVTLLSRLRPRTLLIVGVVALLLGTCMGIVATLLAWAAVYIAAIAVTGVGYGAAYAGALRLILPRASAADRAGVFSIIYVVGYLSFSVPAVVAGIFVSTAGLVPTLIGYGALVMLCSLVALLAQRGRPAA